MTGFGSGRATDGVRVLSVEVRSVNSKTCDVRARLPRDLSSHENRVTTQLKSRVARGRLDVSAELSRNTDAPPEPRVDLALAKGYLRALDRLRSELQLSSPVTLDMILAAPGVIEAPDSAQDVEQQSRLLDRALEAALAELDTMRGREGASLAAELLRIKAEIEGSLALIKAEVPVAVAQRKTKLETRIAELLDGQSIDPVRLAQEVALLVDRSDVTEELTRIESHLTQFAAMLEASEPVGRKLDFLLQEMHREANTIGAKASSARISHLVVDLKSALERLREQVQNVE